MMPESKTEQHNQMKLMDIVYNYMGIFVGIFDLVIHNK